MTKKFDEFINEGTWAMSKNPEDYNKYIKIIQSLKDEMYHVIGDDELFDGFDQAIIRLEEMRDSIK